MHTRQAKLAAAVTVTGINHASADASRRFAMLLFFFVILCPIALSAQTNIVYVNNQSGVTNNVAVCFPWTPAEWQLPLALSARVALGPRLHVRALTA